MSIAKCPYCKKTIVRSTAKKHLDKCPNRPRRTGFTFKQNYFTDLTK